MGRELKRVAIDFNWEIGKLWEGYINPHPYHPCPECDGRGFSKDYQKLQSKWYGTEDGEYAPNPFREGWRYNTKAWQHNLNEDDVAALLAENRLWDFTRVPLNDEHREIIKAKMANGDNSWLPFSNGYIPTPKEVNEWSLKTLGHETINASICIAARLRKLGLSGICDTCKGPGDLWPSEEAKELYENWEPYAPPKGDGFQLWNTTTEGHPMTPVFDSLYGLCEYLEEEGVTTFAHYTATKEEWYDMLSKGLVSHQNGNSIFF